ncbi:glycogen debranching protein GlgX [Pseudactinotalea sp. HY160]|nr:glycogen debranching protein GlgX [Pseudactinotalea sp. HY160]MPV50318.1 glycogen debranching protein GlgX [Pseudactinotalea sp. HY160]
MLLACHAHLDGRYRGDGSSSWSGCGKGACVSSRSEVASDQVAAATARFPHRFGVHCRDGGVDVAVYAPQAEGVYVCFLDRDDSDHTAAERPWREHRVRLLRSHHGVWTAHVPGIEPGRRYGFRAHGATDRAGGRGFNPEKLLVDPYARGITGSLTLDPRVYGWDEDGRPIPGDSAPFVPHGIVMPAPEPARGPRPYVPWAQTVIYEAHVRGLTRKLPGVPADLRGTYAGLAHPATIAHLQRLGITAVELLPIQARLDEVALAERGATNYWGYNTLGFFAPEPGYATAAAQAAGPQAVLAEVTEMVELLHEAGIEVLLDVVYNHTCEGGIDGPMISWRGLDEGGYYLHAEGDATNYLDMTGTGNTLDFANPRVVELTLESLRYWAEVVGVDGYRFDLAVTLGRFGTRFDSLHPLLVGLVTDPVLRHLKLIAEPWDVGQHGWQTGNFLAPMSEWNDRYRDSVRTFWLADQAALTGGHSGHDLRDLATRLAGSADLFGHNGVPGGRGPTASINFVTAHDGFTLADLVAYDHKHNEANGEDNRDGTDNNRSWNHGVEGASTDPGVLAARRRSMRNLFGTLVLSAGVPMIAAGDEIARTQQGNNNGYCIDGDLTWVDWDAAHTGEIPDFTATVTYLLDLRRSHEVLRPAHYRSHTRSGRPTLSWYDRTGQAMEPETWYDPSQRVLQMARVQPEGEGRNLLAIFNGEIEAAGIALPTAEDGRYELVWDSEWAAPDHPSRGAVAAAGSQVTLAPMSLRVYLSS